MERASQEEHNGASFSSVAPSSEGLYMCAERNLVKTPYYSPWFSVRIGKFQLRQKRVPCKSISQGEHNDVKFMHSVLAPFSEELQNLTSISVKTPDYI